MRLADFDYELPVERIAQMPVEPRDAARLLVDRGEAPPDHLRVRDLPEVLRSGDLLVVNDSRVIPARLTLRRQSGGVIEVLLLEPRGGRIWEAMVRNAKKLRVGELLYAGEDAIVRMGTRTHVGDTFEVEFVGDDDPLLVIASIGAMPLPPYITSPIVDPDRYQTVYSDRPGSAAAPTAGLHFTPELLDRLTGRGVERVSVELVVGLDTFQPISVEDPLDHPMHTERYRVPDSTMAAVERARHEGRRIVAVGTTAVRALESAASRGELAGRTDLFIHRGFDWQVVDVLLTNFHLPRTTLLMMIDAFVGPRWRRLYETALAEDYRFLSFGDAMLLDRRFS